jgi:hypothetical protein
MFSVVMVNVGMLSVVAPRRHLDGLRFNSDAGVSRRRRGRRRLRQCRRWGRRQDDARTRRFVLQAPIGIREKSLDWLTRPAVVAHLVELSTNDLKFEMPRNSA